MDIKNMISRLDTILTNSLSDKKIGFDLHHLILSQPLDIFRTQAQFAQNFF